MAGFVLATRPTGAGIVTPDLAAIALERLLALIVGAGHLLEREGERLGVCFITGSGLRLGKVGMPVGHIDRFGRRQLLARLFGLLGGFHANRHEKAGDIVTNPVLHERKQFECLALIFLLGVLLRIPAQMDALTQVIQHGQMLAPVLIDYLQQHRALEARKGLSTHRVDLAPVLGI